MVLTRSQLCKLRNELLSYAVTNNQRIRLVHSDDNPLIANQHLEILGLSNNSMFAKPNEAPNMTTIDKLCPVCNS